MRPNPPMRVSILRNREGLPDETPGTRTVRTRLFDRWRAWRPEEGATIVEAAISFSFLIGLLIGIFEMALALYCYHYVADAAREATRYAIVRGSSSCNNNPNLTNCDATSAEIQTWVQNLGFPGIDPSRLSATTTWPTTGANCYPSTSPCNNPGNLVNVVVTYSFPLGIPRWGGGTLSLSSTSQMVISQ